MLNTVSLVLSLIVILTGSPHVSPRSIRLRFQADKCRSHARSMSLGDAVTQVTLRKMADEYTAQAEEIESKENKPAIEDGSST